MFNGLNNGSVLLRGNKYRHGGRIQTNLRRIYRGFCAVASRGSRKTGVGGATRRFNTGPALRSRGGSPFISLVVAVSGFPKAEVAATGTRRVHGIRGRAFRRIPALCAGRTSRPRGLSSKPMVSVKNKLLSSAGSFRDKGDAVGSPRESSLRGDVDRARVDPNGVSLRTPAASMVATLGDALIGLLRRKCIGEASRVTRENAPERSSTPRSTTTHRASSTPGMETITEMFCEGGGGRSL